MQVCVDGPDSQGEAAAPPALPHGQQVLTHQHVLANAHSSCTVVLCYIMYVIEISYYL